MRTLLKKIQVPKGNDYNLQILIYSFLLARV